MTEPFVKRDLYNRNAYIDRGAFESLLNKLKQIGFNKQKIILPLDDIKKKTSASTPTLDKTLSVDEFLGLDQDFGAIIARLLNESTQEEIGILFVNSTERILHFADNLFPYAGGNIESNLYISTQDPVRTYGLATYIKDFFKTQVRSRGLRIFLGIINIFMFLIGIYIVLNNTIKNQIYTIFGFGIILAPFFSLKFFPQQGLRVSTNKRVPRPPYIEKLKENWLLVVVTALVTLLFTLGGQYLKNLFGL